MIIKVEDVDRDIGFIEVRNEIRSFHTKVRIVPKPSSPGISYFLVEALHQSGERVVGEVSFSLPDDINPALWEIECDSKTNKGVLRINTNIYRYYYNFKCGFGCKFPGIEIAMIYNGKEIGEVYIGESFFPII